MCTDDDRRSALLGKESCRPGKCCQLVTCALRLVEILIMLCTVQLGDGTNNDRNTPPTTDVLTGVAAITAGYVHTCALMTTGGVRCWGRNVYGQVSAASV